jgi:membrane protease YdiL (CAAX protease family)
MDPYRPQQIMSRPAQSSSEVWRVCVGLVLIVIIMFGLMQAILFLVKSSFGEDTYFDVLVGVNLAQTPWTLLMLLALMGLMGVATFVVTETLHGRRAFELLGPPDLFVRQFWQVLRILLPLMLVLQLLPLYLDRVPGLPFGTWMAFLPLTLLGLLIQTGSEELLFRGYLQSNLAARFRNPLIWMFLPSAIFALGHHAPETYGANAWIITAWSFVFGLFAADLTARSGSLGPALALHFVNNLFAIAVTSLNGEMSGLALRTLPFGPDAEGQIRALLYIDFIVMVIGWLSARLALRA